jgi:hypothetical protein
MLALDVRRVQRDGLLIPGRASTWKWARNGEKVASIQMRAEAGRVILDYSSRSNGGEWQAIEYPVLTGVDGLHARWTSGVVPLPGQGMRATCGDPLRRFNLRVSALSQAGLCLPARRC